MNSVTIYGFSDDCIEIIGFIREEFYYLNQDAPMKLAFSDGTVLSVEYTDGFWRVNRLKEGAATYEKTEATDADSDDYSDKVTLTGDIQWVVAGSSMAEAEKGGA